MKLKESDPVCEHCGYDARSQNNNHQLPVGTIVGNQYIIGKVLGQGGFGITYMGYDRIMQQPVAVKEYFPSGYAGRDSHSLTVTSYDNADRHAFESNKQRFLREAESLARLWNIPQVVRVLRHFEENGTAYIAMEYVEGMDLRKFMKRRGRPLSMDEMLNILGPVIQGLSYVHQVELVHRDISPDNIMVLPDGSSKLLDFGAARYVENADADADRSTSTQAILKHGFAPPEQYRTRGALGPWTDIYATCATVYYCLTGRTPPESMSRMMGEGQLDLDSIPGLTLQQRKTLEKGLSLIPRERIQNANVLYQGLFSEVIAARKHALQAEKEYHARLESERQRLLEGLRKAQPNQDESQLELQEQQKKQESKQKAEAENDQLNRTNLSARILITAAVLAIVVIAGCLFFRKPTAVPAETTQPAVVESPIATSAVDTPDLSDETIPTGGQNVLMLQHMLDEEFASAWYAINKSNSDYLYNYNGGKYVIEGVNETIELSPTGFFQMIGSLPVFGSELSRSQIKHVVFLDTLAEAPDHAWDLSLAQNGAVLGWTAEVEPDMYTLYLAGEGGVSSGTSCEWLFYGFTMLESVDFNGCFYTQDAESMSGLFLFCEKLNHLDISTLDTGNVTDMSAMFSHCTSLTELDLSTLNTSKATTMQTMFSSCTGLIQLDISNFDTRNVTNMCQMFHGSSALVTLNLGNLNTSKVTDMSSMFGNCSSLTSLDVSSFDTASVTDMSRMFIGCSALTSLDLSNFNTSRVINMEEMFYDCGNLASLDISGFTNDALVNTDRIFYGCNKLPEEVKQFGA